jgi:CheY-like chemotaxis protein
VLAVLENAVDAQPHGGRVRVRTAVAGHPPGSSVEITVSDAGPGIAAEHVERVFEPFFTTKTSCGGSGLGLSTVYEIVSSHGGHVEVESVPGRGSDFRLYLPAVTETQVRKRVYATVDRRVGQSRHTGLVMLVDDQELVRKAVSRLLRAAGHDVVSVGSGDEAIARYIEGPRPDVVIFDLDMPGMSGDECWRRLRASDPALKAFFLSGSCDDGKRQALLREGALGFLQKPVDAKVLRHAVSAVLAAAAASTESG